MQRRELESVRVGDVLGRSVVDADGRPLLRAGTMLTDAYLQGLSRRGFYAVYVRDGLADDVAPQEAISQRVRSSVTQHVGEAFSQ
ncbi:MAG: HD-GYP domain-containing protein, partial [Nitriliruptoraceae bacterium]